MLIRFSYKKPGPIKSSILLDRMSSDLQILFGKTEFNNTSMTVGAVFKPNVKSTPAIIGNIILKGVSHSEYR